MPMHRDTVHKNLKKNHLQLLELISEKCLVVTEWCVQIAVFHSELETPLYASVSMPAWTYKQGRHGPGGGVQTAATETSKLIENVVHCLEEEWVVLRRGNEENDVS